jgi:hypothetical protein
MSGEQIGGSFLCIGSLGRQNQEHDSEHEAVEPGQTWWKIDHGDLWGQYETEFEKGERS